MIAPDGALYYLPFESLLTKDASPSGRAEYRQLSYLIKPWSISYVPSASVLASLRQNRPKPTDATATATTKTFVAFADPVYDFSHQPSAISRQPQDREAKNQGPRTESHGPRTTGHEPRTNTVKETWRSVFEESGRWELRSLGESRREVTGIAHLYKPDEVALYLREAATEKNVKGNPYLSTARRIHFATHGVISEKQPQYSGLILSLSSALPNPQSAIRNRKRMGCCKSMKFSISSSMLTWWCCPLAGRGWGKKLKAKG